MITRVVCKNQKPNNGQHGLRNGSSMAKESDEKLVKLAKQLVKSHPELSFHNALQIESQRQDAKKKRDEDGTVAVWNHMTIDYDLEEYMKESKEKDNRNVQEMKDCVVEIMELKISGDNKENCQDDSKKRQTLKIRNANSSNKKK
ncbi:hypothetical protein GCK72_012616 [Caenorhabditis remanei]|uniref:Uncharacterized protein n=1 Tax=Caenorhabditis remanei TaxID=31234 RepID=A0A6A5GNI1_CAERE|nr:hypothetical protein GCK72_012616 [Caenorhabditis remanei]KAF1756163.1 hypothetical protein GCK72_012616 [Caenorhabditis remanei]